MKPNFVVCRTIAASLALTCAGAAENGRLTSPDGLVSATVSIGESGQLSYAVTFRGVEVIAPSPIGLTLDGRDLGKVVTLTALRVREAHERYPVCGAHAEARLDAQRALYCAQSQSGLSIGVQVMVANEGFAWRIVAPGRGTRRVNAETACWRLPMASRVWFAERLSDWKLKTYAGEWISAPLAELYKVSPQGPVQPMPLVAELPQGAGYALVTEAALFRYSGLRLRAGSDGALWGCFTESEGFDVCGTVQTPWRVVMLASTLDALVNNDLVNHLSPPPDPALFGDAEWVRGGRSVWSWWQGLDDYMSVASEKRLIDRAAELTFEFTTLDEGWEAWTNAWDVLKEVCDYGHANGVRVFVWKHSKELWNPEKEYAALRVFLDQVQAAGAAGVKIDFMNSESFETIAFDECVLREAAKRKLLVNFHGCQKPTGESRTYPNEVTREGVRGLELNRITEGYLKAQREKGVDVGRRVCVPRGENQNISASHNAALPFTRCVVGPADYTPLAFSRTGNTTWAHQLAMAYLVSSPLLVMADHPQRLFNETGLGAVIPLIKTLPVSWDETRVLEGSRIGELAAFARRKGDVWYVAMVNGTDGLKMVSFSPQFVGWDRMRLTQVSDMAGQTVCVASQTRSALRTESIIVTLEPCGGYVAKLERE